MKVWFLIKILYVYLLNDQGWSVDKTVDFHSTNLITSIFKRSNHDLDLKIEINLKWLEQR